MITITFPYGFWIGLLSSSMFWFRNKFAEINLYFQICYTMQNKLNCDIVCVFILVFCIKNGCVTILVLSEVNYICWQYLYKFTMCSYHFWICLHWNWDINTLPCKTVALQTEYSKQMVYYMPFGSTTPWIK